MERNPREHRQASTAAWVSITTNILLMVGKGGIGLAAGSRALFADAIHSAADLAGSVAVMIGLRVARKPPDEDHPYGHGKAELISSALVACLLIAASFDVGYRSIHAFWEPPTNPQLVSAYTAAAAIVIKELLFRYNFYLGRKLNSRSLLAQATDHRSDVWSSVAALAGILLSLLGQRLHVHWLMYMDAVAGALVAALVLKMGYGIATDSVHLLMDRVVPEEQLEAYRRGILPVSGVVDIDDIRARDHGTYIIVDVKISVDATISVAEGHAVAARVKEQLMLEFPQVQDVFVHVNPYFVMEEDSEGDRE